MKRTDLAYAAGIIDGEGSICICKHRNKGARDGFDYLLTLQVHQANEWLCQWLKFAFGGSVGLTTKANGRNIWLWCIAANKAKETLILLLPYLQMKRPQAELAIKFQNGKRVVGRQGKKEVALAIEEAQHILLKGMHHIW